MKRIIDVSLTIGPDLMVWPGDPAAEVVPRLQMSKGDAANVSEVLMGTHTGTHVDPQLHFVEGGAGVDAVPVDTFVGGCVVADARGLHGPLGRAELDALKIPSGTTRLLIKSDNSKIWRRKGAAFPDEYVCLAPEGAKWVVAAGIKLVGVDFLSVEQKGARGHPVHVELLKNGVVIVEGLDLGDVAPGEYTVAILPLKIAAGDGGPARAVLIEEG